MLGRFVPLIDLSVWEPVGPDITEEELGRRASAGPWYSTEEVVSRLRKR